MQLGERVREIEKGPMCLTLEPPFVCIVTQHGVATNSAEVASWPVSPSHSRRLPALHKTKKKKDGFAKAEDILA